METGFGPVGLDHGCAVNGRWEDLENGIKATDEVGDATRTRALYDRVRHGFVQQGINNKGEERVGAVEGVRAIVTGHTPVHEPIWHENVLGIDTGVHITERGYGRLTIARSDAREIETLSFNR